ncbi:UDP-N-acetylmuramoyl-L-alanyl-D-glutamate--2,6-diaminopimelate ligase [Cytophaga hutchinsonii]|uniref:UDP-N-acetylmuramoyl-L-alanyl-D-glutamate--2,6-diaminopimelate ligase n=1 Tax=Cytophaga hutchinsonii (strain ATCC 33406 / DSM 1761 / CIP 103989 / NBRC 15051 / NCIMB 9469 / D465) TaxID=269798 RepID=MURE_CYTH3|nr:UDP-N-acetylmuramoyl-L-alanyl-D-glutamate--2,6-diaminopimelate ligase [Cytophaga hutchinsonii]Q11RG9.1 RecName: Full=UDP-N-acetylmuramoyl-L-alanyl-D-glutamate--2,6-diaminopimelate ligase; AltName: Full=Meso-A2pm-adding enzyme; AltName: Full=Meso-diaminopimelate-adding enzyme; AltName: Full=UDP-MurNAc-L-Ala-D-Glu:meso-diaminopimelate ligase; AltName: Full=UDP-MurNAc-tripeptide synthetase; AltName: Full=UDP-N-acetylmuramyl-tripeptide synthetase [Cytophaga hutchinsonii ATCC 33406]ABG59995.1 UDP-N
MQIKDLIYKVSLISVSGRTDVDVTAICFDSRKVEKGSMFIAVRGVSSDGHSFIADVIQKGATAVVCEELPEIESTADCTIIQVKDSAEALGMIASNFYDSPSSKLKLVGVTGTNGKTTTVTLLYRLFRKLGYKTGLLSTVENIIEDKVVQATHTTPDAISLNKLLADMVKAGCTHCFMEVSSHAAVQRRIAGLQFAGGLFSNITHDHLDYHKTFDEYIKAKKLFFDGLPNDSFALINSDDKRGRVMIQNTRAKTYTYSLLALADFKGKLISTTMQGLEMDVDGIQAWFRLIGNFNAYNLLAVYATAVLLGEDKEEVLMQLSTIEAANGRFEQQISATRITVIVDYAHTPDALKNVLETITELKGANKIITVVGCGGNRDAAKRPVMADIACQFSDHVVLTSDNPRNEEPQAILTEMEKGVRIVDKKKVLSVLDRKEAIKVACTLASTGDIILVAGKGHETYQEIKGVKYPFDDRLIIKELLDTLGK